MVNEPPGAGDTPGPYEAVDHLVALQSARRRLLDALEDLDDDAAGQVVHGEWRVRDLLTHLAAWDRLVLGFVNDLAAGRRSFDLTAPPEDDWAGWNATQVAAGDALPLRERLRELDAARDALMEATYRLERADLDLELLAPWGFVDSVLGHIVTQAVHDSQHTDQILEALRRR
jgi:uncharacterized damage-inducible protein DinB